MASAAFLSLLLLPPAVASDKTGDSEGDGLVANVQMELNEFGYDAGPEDGVLGLATFTAIRRFQADQGLHVTGTIDDPLLAHIADPRRAVRRGPVTGRPDLERRREEGSGAASQRHLDQWMERNFDRAVGAFEAALDSGSRD